MKEIGSEFWKKGKSEKVNNLEYFNIGTDIKFLMCGRTAIDYILNDIELVEKKVYMPDYCCESMVTPFLEHGFEVSYYNVEYKNKIRYNIDTNKECSIFFGMSYFGYSDSNMDDYIEKFNKKGIFVIEDITHRLFQKKNHCEHSNYLIASLRKWFPIYSGGIAVNMRETFKKDTSNYIVDEEMIRQKRMAMEMKRDYIEGKQIDKSIYLKLYNKSNEKIKNYKNKKIDGDSLEILKEIEINEMIKIRKENAQLIEDKLKRNKNIKLIFNQKENDCPLFVPILIEKRDEIRKKMINEKIYCPVHWPNFNDIDKDIYKYEVSLICDQRYTKKEINKYIDKLLEIVGE